MRFIWRSINEIDIEEHVDAVIQDGLLVLVGQMTRHGVAANGVDNVNGQVVKAALKELTHHIRTLRGYKELIVSGVYDVLDNH